jgi:uncharacterized membrane protein
MGQVKTSTTIEADISTVFDYVSDYRTAVKYSRDLKKWEPVTDVTDDIGAQFDASLQLGPKAFASRVEINFRQEPEQFGWTSISGFDHSGRYTFTAGGEGRTEVEFVFDYTLPGGMAGRLLARTTEPLLKASLASNLKTLKQQVEEQARTGG